MVKLTRDEHILKTWVGRTEEFHDILDVNQARQMQATMDREPSFKDGDALPCLWHWIYFPNGMPLGSGFINAIQFCLFRKVQMQREKRKDMLKHIRAFSIPRHSQSGAKQRQKLPMPHSYGQKHRKDTLR